MDAEREANCNLCNKPIDFTYEDDYREDDSGINHEECLNEYWEKEAGYYLSTYQAHKRANPVEDASDAYEWGDPKNAHYVAWAIENADATRE
jgi:hypothetical protein